MISLSSYTECNTCPRNCGVNRIVNANGYCNCDDKPLVSSIFLHKGEEPVISGTHGICNVFFAHCNLQCIYCQNIQISRNKSNDLNWFQSVDKIGEIIENHLKKGVRHLGFVSPSHQINQMIQIIESVWEKGFRPTIVYNSNGYDSVDTLKKLEGIVDVYLPDFKYFDNSLGRRFSKVSNYSDVAKKSIKEMFRQKGSTVILDDNGLIESGMIIRHLVLPGCTDDSIKILEYLADEISSNLHISLMSQYYPIKNISDHTGLNRKLLRSEYAQVVFKLEQLGFRGWVQGMESSDYYKPDFLSNTPFDDILNG